MNSLFARPRLLGLICGSFAALIGMIYLWAANAPSTYPVMNLAALVLGATLWLASGGMANRLAGASLVNLLLAAALLLTALFGEAAGGASRWVALGPLSLQTSLIVLPLMLVLYSRRTDKAGTAALMIGALALALQPDRAMAGTLALALAGLWLIERRRLSLLALAAAIASFAWTMVRPDRLPEVRHVDQVYFVAFELHPGIGLSVALGAALLFLPALLAAYRNESERTALIVFSLAWAAIVLAAAFGNYPTPVVGYGGSAVLGYLLSAAFLPRGTGERRRTAAPTHRIEEKGAGAPSEFRSSPTG
jgi:cell division protein FtsW (lipid II flippase)